MFGKRLRELRLSHNFTLRQLGEATHISYASLSNYENGTQQPNFETLEKLADFFDVRLDYLTGKSDFPTVNDYMLNENLEGLAHIHNNQRGNDMLSGLLDYFYLITNQISDTNDNGKSIETLKKVMEHLFSIQTLAKKVAMPLNKEYINSLYEDYLREKNELDILINELFNSVRDANRPNND